MYKSLPKFLEAIKDVCIIQIISNNEEKKAFKIYKTHVQESISYLQFIYKNLQKYDKWPSVIKPLRYNRHQFDKASRIVWKNNKNINK